MHPAGSVWSSDAVLAAPNNFDTAEIEACFAAKTAGTAGARGVKRAHRTPHPFISAIHPGDSSRRLRSAASLSLFASHAM